MRRLLISGLLMSLALGLFAATSIAGRWATGGLWEFLLGAMISIGTTGYLLSIVVCRIRRAVFRNQVLAAAGLMVAFVLAVTVLLRVNPGAIVREQEIRRAVEAGLQQDCERLLKNWPVKYGLIFQSSPEFERLPASIRMLNPVYVTSDHMLFPRIPPHIGICTCGFGGFAAGVRVFQSDQEAAECMKLLPGGYERVVSGVYFGGGT